MLDQWSDFVQAESHLDSCQYVQWVEVGLSLKYADREALRMFILVYKTTVSLKYNRYHTSSLETLNSTIPLHSLAENESASRKYTSSLLKIPLP